MQSGFDIVYFGHTIHYGFLLGFTTQNAKLTSYLTNLILASPKQCGMHTQTQHLSRVMLSQILMMKGQVTCTLGV